MDSAFRKKTTEQKTDLRQGGDESEKRERPVQNEFEKNEDRRRETESLRQEDYLARDLGKKALVSLGISDMEGGVGSASEMTGGARDDDEKPSVFENRSTAIEKESYVERGDMEKEESAEKMREILPVFDTAETIAAHQEKMKKGIKVVVGGPPHSGKSVFIEGLTANLDRTKTFSFSAAPDGEGAWLQKHYNDPEVVKLRRKGKFTPEFVADRKKKIHDWEGPLMMIDIGGRTSEENAQMIEGATHAIILAGDLSKMSEWRNFFEQNNVQVIAKLHSHYQGNKDIQRPMEPEKEHIVSSVYHLERGEPSYDRETIKQVAGLISDLVENNSAYKQAREIEGKNPFEIFIPEVFSELPHEASVRVITGKDGQQKTLENKNIVRYAVPQIYEKALEFDGQPAWLNGGLNSWAAVAMALAFEEAGSPDVRLRSPDGYVSVKNLPQVSNPDKKWWDEPQMLGYKNGSPIYFVHNTAHVANNSVKPEDLETMSIPKLPENATVIISSQGPNWLKASIASGYRGKVANIAAFQPGEGSTIAWSNEKGMLGTRIVNEFRGELLELKKPEIPLSQYLKDAERNLQNTSRIAHGIIDTSDSLTKGEMIEVNAEDNVENLAQSGTKRAIEAVFNVRDYKFENATELRSFVEWIAETVNGGILKDGVLLRSGADSDKYPYTKIADLPVAMDKFYSELLTRMNDPVADPVETAAFVEYGIDLTGHFFADGCEETSKVISSFVLMRANHELPDYTRGEDKDYEQIRKEYYGHAPKQIQGIDPVEDAKAFKEFADYYKTLF